MALDIRALARAAYDPRQFPGAYSDEKRRLGRLESDAYAAQFADPRSVIAQNSPLDSRSIASRELPGLFGPQGALQPAQPAQPAQPQQPAVPGLLSPDDMMRSTFSDGIFKDSLVNGKRKTRRTFSSEI